MPRQSRPVTSREYKVMLRASRFVGNGQEVLAATEHFRSVFARAIGHAVAKQSDDPAVRGVFEPKQDDKQATVQFYDTKDRRLRNAGFVFRQRQPLSGGPLELTLKRRHRDRFFVSGSKTGGKTKFEEDIKATVDHEFLSLYSLSGKVTDVDAGTEFHALKDIRRVFKPVKSQLGDAYEGRKELLRVCDFIANQTVLEGVEFQASDKARAQCAVIVWHRKGGNAASPDVVEFSFRYRDKGLGAKQEPFTTEMAERCFKILQVFRDERSPLAAWVDLNGPTKTSYAYGLTRA
ncbi:hypothetical protein Enr13x_57870 [Stieleria neptunia]|uniref:Uncharacterized protein n=1 Tax=Stieleria neptunia TaxID=2527979 RepID=A0A518HYM5_9BACT|nr:hypothetical protein [Stieleria neptunia]QDV45884.1 hypothetical protein Enr13x_57870 [Stieleria neptunia]